jgi:hypothetical protein
MHMDSKEKKGEQEAFDVMLAHLRGQGRRSVLAAAQSTLHDMRPDDLDDLEGAADWFAGEFGLVYTAPTYSEEK